MSCHVADSAAVIVREHDNVYCINNSAPPSNGAPTSGIPSSNNAASNNTVLGLSKLPRELRNKIWDLTLPQQRVVNIRYNANKNACTTPAHSPISLHICQESRERALKRYTLSFGTKEGEARIYFNFEDDVLYMDMDRAEPTTITEQGALCRTVHHFVNKTEDNKKVKFFSCDEIAVKWMAILRGGKFFNLTSLKMFVTHAAIRVLSYATISSRPCRPCRSNLHYSSF